MKTMTPLEFYGKIEKEKNRLITVCMSKSVHSKTLEAAFSAEPGHLPDEISGAKVVHSESNTDIGVLIYDNSCEMIIIN